MEIITEFFSAYMKSLGIIIGLVAIYFIIKTFLKNRTKNVKESDAVSISEELDNLSANKNKTRLNRKIINKILEKDYESILTNLKSESLCFHKLLAIKANIENQLNSDDILDKEIGKIFGVLIAFAIGIVTTVFLGSYSGAVGTLISEIVKKEKENKLNRESIDELTQFAGNIHTKINFDEILNYWIFIALLIYLVVVFIRGISHTQYKFDNRVNVLLDLVNYAIELKKEQEKGIENELLTKNKNILETEVIEVIKTIENKARKETLIIKLKN